MADNTKKTDAFLLGQIHEKVTGLKDDVLYIKKDVSRLKKEALLKKGAEDEAKKYARSSGKKWGAGVAVVAAVVMKALEKLVS